MFGIMFVLFIYLCAGALSSYFVFIHGHKKNWDNGDRKAVGFLSILFWPIIFPIVLLFSITSALDNAAEKAARR